MPSVTIDLTEQEHDRLTARAAREGRSVSDLVKCSILPDPAGYEADLAALAAFLEPRIRDARSGNTVCIPEGKLVEHLQRRAARRNG